MLQRRVVEAEQRLASVPRLIEEGWEEELRNAYDTSELERLALEYQQLVASNQEMGYHVRRNSATTPTRRSGSPTTSRTYRKEDRENPIYRMVDELSMEVAALRTQVQVGNGEIGEVKGKLFEEERTLKRSCAKWQAHLDKAAADLEVAKRKAAKLVKENEALKLAL